MPSDERVTGILEQLAPQRDLYRSAVAEASEQLRAILANYRNSSGDDAERAAFELGRFARGRIDPSLFALVFGEHKTIDPETVDWIDRAEAVLQEIAASVHMLQYARVTPGSSLRFTVDRALARIGRAFGAVRVAEYARSGHHIGAEAQFLDVFPFGLWNKTERKVGLPLIVEVDGKDLHVGGLEEFLDGTQIIVLLVNGEAPPARLARLITPNVFVLQTAKLEEIALAASAAGPAIAALVPETCTEFVHQKGKVEIRSNGTLANGAVAALGRIGVFQQREELNQLNALARTPAPEQERAAMPATAPEPESVLAAWLLRQADVA